jgi:ribonuclease P protein component
MLSLKNRLTTPTEFYQIKKSGKKASNSYFSILYILDKSSNNPKLSVVISKAYAPKATTRNKIKRITRHLSREFLTKLPNGLKAIVFPKTKILQVNHEKLKSEFEKVISEIKQ